MSFRKGGDSYLQGMVSAGLEEMDRNTLRWTGHCHLNWI